MTTLLDPRTTPARPDLAAERLRGLVPAARYVPGLARRVVAPVAPLRRAPASDAPLDTEAQWGELVTVYDEAGGFSWAELGSDGYVGYLPSAALGPPGPAPTHRVAALRSFAYPAPDMKRPATAFVGLGARVVAAAGEGGFVRIDGLGWVFAAHLVPLDQTEPDFVAVAERLVGTPYLWGGRTTLGLDCSGLVQLALDAAGTAVPRDSDMQEGLGLPLDRRGLRRGDLVFWRGHVGIMTDPATVLHANGHHMAVAAEPLAEAEARIRSAGGGPIRATRRLPRG